MFNNNKHKETKDLSKINHEYLYNSDDIQAILISRLKDENTPGKFSKEVSVLAAANNIGPDSLKNILNGYKSSNDGKGQILLIPYCLEFVEPNTQSNNNNIIRGNHWVGVLIEIEGDGQISKVQYLDSLPNSTGPNESFKTQIESVYGHLNLIESQPLQQDDGVSCGSYMIENLLRAAKNDPDLDQNVDAKTLRELDLESLEKNRRDYVSLFLANQKPSMNALIDVLDELKVSIDPFFKDIASLQSNAKAEDLFKLVNDKKHGFSLKSRIESLPNIDTFLRSYKNTRLRAYSIPVVGGMGGVGTSWYLGAGFAEASQAWWAAQTAAQGARAAATLFFSPVALGVTAAVSGASWLTMHTARSYAKEFAAKIERALLLYEREDNLSPDSGLLEEAEKILKFELGIGQDSKYRITIATRWLESSTKYQTEFASLLLAQILAMRQDSSAYTMFVDLQKTTTNNTLKVMSLLGQIDVLSKMSSWVNKGGITMKDKDRVNKLELTVLDLNLEYKELIREYFKNLWDSWEKFYSGVKSKQFLRNPEKFDGSKLYQVMKNLISTNDLHCLLHVGSKRRYGQLAILVFNFIQGLCHVATEEAYSASQKDYDFLHKESNLAVDKFKLCLELIRASDFEKYNVDAIDKIADTVGEYSVKYIQQNKKTYKPGNENNTNSKFEIKEKGVSPSTKDLFAKHSLQGV